jgi:hypothetical protein
MYRYIDTMICLGFSFRVKSILYMIKRIIDNALWRFSMDLITVLSLFGFSIVGFYNLILFLINNKIMLIVVAILGLIIITFFYKSASNLKNKFIVAKTKNEAQEITRLSEIDFIKGLPSNKILEGWWKLAENRAKKWEANSTLSSFNFYTNHGYYPSFFETGVQSYYFSSLKNLTAAFYIPRDDEQPSELVEENNNIDSVSVIPFFKRYPNWRNTIKKIYESIEDKLPQQYSLQVASQSDSVSFNFDYFEGRAKVRHTFIYDGKTLKDKKLNKTVDVS